MIRRLFLWALLLVGVVSFGPQPRAWWQSIQQVAISGAPAGYTGPGDIATFKTWYGVRAYSAATRGNVAMNVCNVADVACADLSTDATTGDLIIGTIGGSSCSVVVCTVKTWYDQTGANSCTGAHCNVTQATIGSRPTLVVSCVGGKPCLACVGQTLGATNSFTSVAQPYTFSSVSQRTGLFTSSSFVADFTSGAASTGYTTTTNQGFVSAGTTLTGTATNSVFHAFQGVLNGASSDNYIDGSSNSGNGGAAAAAGTINICSISGSLALTGNVAEFGIIASDLGGSKSTMNSNQHTYYGF